MISSALLSICTILSLTFNIANGGIMVQTESGPIRGKKLGNVDAFLGIPYAEPPTDQLRFAKPVPKKPWSETYDATSLPPPCVQVDVGESFFAPDISDMTEDCLYLNIWAPSSRSSDELKTVMVYIHGGGLMFGSSNMELYNGTNLAENGDVIVVTMNYRLGALGFFAGFTEDSPGSQGLYDQLLALQWIKDNAKHFQGDPDNIVLFGESAGSISVSIHQVSPLSKDLFNRAILQSGSSISPICSRTNEVILELSQTYADMLGCTKENTDFLGNRAEVVDCLRSKPASTFSLVDMEIMKTKQLCALPSIGTDLLPEQPIELFRKGQFKNSEVMMGIDRNEGTTLLTLVLPDLLGVLGEKADAGIFNKTSAYEAIKSVLGESISDEDETIIQSYLDDVNDEKGYLEVMGDVIADYIIICGQIFQAEYQSIGDNRVYFYMLDHRAQNSPFAEWMGVPHGSEIIYVFGNPGFLPYFTEYDKELSKDMMAMWTNFAKTGNPNIPGGINWPQYSYDDPKYLIIGKRDKVGRRPDHNRCERWRNRFQSVMDESVIQALKTN